MSQSEYGVEAFVPALRADIDIRKAADGSLVLFHADGRLLDLGQSESSIFSQIDGQNSLSQIVETIAAQRDQLVVHEVVSLVGRLARQGWLANSDAEISTHGLVASSVLHRRWLQRILDGRRHSVGLGQVLSLFAPRGQWAPGTRVLSLLSVFASLVAVGFGGWVLQRGQASAFRVGDSYATALLVLYFGVFCALAARMWLRVLQTRGEGHVLRAAGAQWHGLFIGPTADCRNIFLSGRHAGLRLAIAGIFGVSVAVVAFALSAFFVSVPLLYPLLTGAMLVLMLDLCPYLPADGGRLIDLTAPQQRGRRRALHYLRRRLLHPRRMPKVSATELHHVLTIGAGAAWAVLLLKWGAAVMRQEASALRDAGTLGALSSTEGVAAFFVLATPVVASLWVVLLGVRELFHMIKNRLPTRATLLATDDERVRRVIRACPLYEHLDEGAVDSLAAAGRVRRFAPNRNIVVQGQSGDEFFLILKGAVEILEALPDGTDSRIAGLNAGDGFGEIALLEDRPRTATVRTYGSVVTWSVDKKTFQELINSAGVASEEATKMLRISRALKESKWLRGMSPGSIHRMASRCESACADAGATIIEEGTPGDTFYFLQSGAAQVSRDGAHLAELNAGESFGEIALLSGVPRTASVVATQSCQLITLKRENFHEVLSGDFEAALRLEQIAFDRDIAGEL